MIFIALFCVFSMNHSTHIQLPLHWKRTLTAFGQTGKSLSTNDILIVHENEDINVISKSVEKHDLVENSIKIPEKKKIDSQMGVYRAFQRYTMRKVNQLKKVENVICKQQNKGSNLSLKKINSNNELSRKIVDDQKCEGIFQSIHNNKFNIDFKKPKLPNEMNLIPPSHNRVYFWG